MAYDVDEQAAIDRLASFYNGNPYDGDTNEGGMAVGGHRVNEIPMAQDMAAVAEAVAEEAAAAASSATASAGSATAASGSATSAQGFRDEAEGFRDEAETFKNQAASAVASAQFPVVTTTGTGSAYVADFDPNLTIVDGAGFRLNIHTANSATPTLAVDGGSAKEMVRNNFGDDIAADEMPAGSVAVVMYEETLDKYVVLNLQEIKWRQDVNANGKGITNQRGWNRQIVLRNEVANTTDDEFVLRAQHAFRLHNVAPDLSAGTVDVTLKKNGTAIDFGAGPSTTLSCTTTRTVTAVNHSSLAYIDFAVGDKMTIARASASSATDLTIDLDTTENYSA